MKLDRRVHARLRARLPPGVVPAPVALERTVWAAIEARVSHEAALLRADGLLDKALHWEQRLRTATAARDRIIRARREEYFLRREEGELRALSDWREGDRLLQLLGVTTWTGKAEVVEIID